MPSRKEEALAAKGPQEGGQALVLADSFTALATGDLSTVREIIEGNFGKGQINFNDLDRVKLPAGGGLAWDVITLEGETSQPELRGIIVAWADKKAWWPMSMEDGDGGPPVCRAETVWDGGRKGIGLGDPTVNINAKEEELLKAKPGLLRTPKKLKDGGWDCSTCIHNQFGSHLKHGGKACQDKRPVMMLDANSLLPFVILLPATSILPIKEFFGRMARNGLPFFGAIISLKLAKDKSAGGITYSKVVPTLVERLKPEHMAVARGYSQMLMPLLQGSSTMNQPALYQEGEQQKASSPTPDSMADLISSKQFGLIKWLAAESGVEDMDAACAEFFRQPGLKVVELSKDAASRFIGHLQDDVAAPTPGAAAGGNGEPFTDQF